VCCRNVQLTDIISETYRDMATEIWKIRRFQRPHEDVPARKRLRLSTNGLYCQKLELLTYIFAADSTGLHSLVFT